MTAFAKLFELIPGWCWAIACAALLLLAGVERARGQHARTVLAQLQMQVEKDRAARSEAARKDEAQTATKEHEHATQTLAAVERFTLAQPGRELLLRSQLLDAGRLRDSAESRASRYRAQAEGDAAARRGLADRCAALDASLAEGRQVVAELRGVVVQRDAEVALLADQMRADRALLDAPAGVSLFPPPVR